MIYLEFLLPYFCFHILIMTLFSVVTGEEVLVTIPQGTLRGQKEVSPIGDIYYSFSDIPYAKPPIGELRFKPPQPAGKWTGIRDATKAVKACPQNDIFTLSYSINSTEDCLMVHVYTKEIPKPGKKYPVLVWVHGGAFNMNFGNKNFFSPDYAMGHDIVLVAFNYRLGALGFLSLQTPDYPGNMGLKDQQLAFKWVQDNIAHFGGDPDRVTIYGNSAGASSVHYHLLSPSSKGLFHGAILMSAAANNFWGYQTRPREYAYLLGKRLGYNGKNDQDLMNLLKKTSPERIVEKSVGILMEFKEQQPYENVMNCSFVPTAEPEHDGAFITTRPLMGEYQADVPILIAHTDKEMIMEIYKPEQVPKWTEDKEFQAVFPRDIRVKKDSEKSLTIAKKIREFYFKNGMSIDGYIDVLSDTYFNHGIYRAVKHRLDHKLKSPTYLMLFTFDGKANFLKKYLKLVRHADVQIEGAGHADDHAYFFVFPKPNFTLAPGSPEFKTMQRKTQFWINFTKTGAPTNEKSEIQWPPLKTSDDVYLEFGKDLKLKKGLLKERMKFWDEIYELAEKD